ncbi:GNAT family N-acetyltransferase [Nocardia sp. NPDC051833]|uniref:GNAT family N-acetyltransferase n=1 Tax=Nocardia sp. NPDC051833 TaxID=3155674 RepID=UPI00343FDC74
MTSNERTMLRVVRTDAREWAGEHAEELNSEKFPKFIRADRVVDQYMSRVLEFFPELSLMLLDEQDVPVASGSGVPIRWDGRTATLPTGYTQALVQAVEGRERREPPDTLVICGAVVVPSLRGRGYAGQALMALRRAAEAAGLSRVIVPVRPTTKAFYPLTPIESFMTWRRDDGTAFDPWVRTHERLGAKILTAAPASQTMTGTVSEWERWTRLPLPESGDYVIRGGLSVLRVDRSADQGVYHEPNIWMRHV